MLLCAVREVSHVPGPSWSSKGPWEKVHPQCARGGAPWTSLAIARDIQRLHSAPLRRLRQRAHSRARDGPVLPRSAAAGSACPYTSARGGSLSQKHAGRRAADEGAQCERRCCSSPLRLSAAWGALRGGCRGGGGRRVAPRHPQPLPRSLSSTLAAPVVAASAPTSARRRAGLLARGPPSRAHNRSSPPTVHIAPRAGPTLSTREWSPCGRLTPTPGTDTPSPLARSRCSVRVGAGSALRQEPPDARRCCLLYMPRRARRHISGRSPLLRSGSASET